MATESFFSNASLAYLASAGAGKDGKAYSIKPTDGTGDFTFSRGSNLAATRVGADGLIEKGRENLLKQSNNFGTTWGSSATITSGQSGYDGSSDAWLMTTAIFGDFVAQSLSDDGVLTFSIYAKAGSVNGIRLRMDAAVDANAYFDLTSTGSVFATSGDIDAKIEPVSGATGWFRVSVAANISSVVKMAIYTTDGTTSYDNGSIYIQDAQLEIGLAATDYIESGATTGKAGLLENEPRFDYSGGATCPSLLLEPSRTNLIPNSEYLIDGLTNVTATYNYGTSPDGLNNSTFLLPSASLVAHRIGYTDLFTYSASTSYCASAFIKIGGHRYVSINIVLRNSGSFQETASGFVDLQENTIVINGSNTLWTDIDVFKEEYTNGFYRYGITAKTPASGSDRVDVQFNITDENGDSFVGNGTDGVVFYGLQAEEGSYPTSYIPNHSGGSVTRGGDSCTGAVNASNFNDSEGVLYAEISALANDGTFRNISVSNGTTAQAIRIYYRNNDNQITFLLGSSSGSSLTTSVPSATDFIKVAAKYDTDTIKLFVNGVLTNTLGSLTMPTGLQQLDFNIAGVLPLYGNTKQVLYFPEALPDADCIALTTL